MDYPNLWWLLWPKAVFQPVICHRMFWMVNLIVLAKKLYGMMKTFETTTMLVNLATKLTVTGVFLIDTQTTVMIKVTA